MKATPITSRFEALEALDDLRVETMLVDQALLGLAHANCLLNEISGVQEVLDLMKEHVANIVEFLRTTETAREEQST